MREELEALHKNETWKITILPQGAESISCKWVYKVKRKADGLINKFKARLVAKRFLQVYGLYYHDSFAHVAMVVTVRLLLAFVANQGWHVHQMDIN